MKKLIVFVFALVCVLGLVGCQNKPNTPAEIDVDSVVMLYENDKDLDSSAKVTITDKEIISELLAMHNSMRTEKTREPVADKRMWIIFCKDDEHVIEWTICTRGEDWSNALFITYSTMLTEDNQVVKNTRDFSRIIEIFNAATE